MSARVQYFVAPLIESDMSMVHDTVSPNAGGDSRFGALPARWHPVFKQFAGPTKLKLPNLALAPKRRQHRSQDQPALHMP